MGVISGSGSFPGRFESHFRVGDHFGVGIISGAVQNSHKKYFKNRAQIPRDSFRDMSFQYLEQIFF